MAIVTEIGEAIAHKFALEGAKLVLNGLPDELVGDVAETWRRKDYEAVAYTGDVSEDEHARTCVRQALDSYGQLDILVNNAVIFLDTNEMRDYELTVFDQLLKNSLRSAF